MLSSLDMDSCLNMDSSGDILGLSLFVVRRVGAGTECPAATWSSLRLLAGARELLPPAEPLQEGLTYGPARRYSAQCPREGRTEEGSTMARPRTGRPTDAELEILQVLWERGPSTVGQVQQAIAHSRPVGYTTIQKALQIMMDKRLVVADRSQRAHVFRPREPQMVVVGRMVKDLVRRALGGSTSQLVLHALSGRRASLEELEEIRRLLDDAERQQRAG
jgi:predicted transcriptional regulator